jgi:hypothetical protein
MNNNNHSFYNGDNNYAASASFDDKLKAMIAERNRFDDNIGDNCWKQPEPSGPFDGFSSSLSSIGMNVNEWDSCLKNNDNNDNYEFVTHMAVPEHGKPYKPQIINDANNYVTYMAVPEHGKPYKPQIINDTINYVTERMTKTNRTVAERMAITRMVIYEHGKPFKPTNKG